VVSVVVGLAGPVVEAVLVVVEVIVVEVVAAVAIVGFLAAVVVEAVVVEVLVGLLVVKRSMKSFTASFTFGKKVKNEKGVEDVSFPGLETFRSIGFSEVVGAFGVVGALVVVGALAVVVTSTSSISFLTESFRIFALANISMIEETVDKVSFDFVSLDFVSFAGDGFNSFKFSLAISGTFFISKI
jgi:hypothetical protein